MGYAFCSLLRSFIFKATRNSMIMPISLRNSGALSSYMIDGKGSREFVMQREAHSLCQEQHSMKHVWLYSGLTETNSSLLSQVQGLKASCLKPRTANNVSVISEHWLSGGRVKNMATSDSTKGHCSPTLPCRGLSVRHVPAFK